MRFLSTLLMLLLIVSALTAVDEITLPDAGTIEVERQVVVKERLPLAKSLPFTLSAPSGGFGYVWDTPQGVKANRVKNTLEVTGAPYGVLSISVTWHHVDFDKKEIVDRAAKITLVVIDLKPPTPPDPLTAELRAIYQADTSTDKAVNLAKLTAVFRAAATAAESNKSVQTAQQLADAVRAIPRDPTSRLYVPSDALPAIRKKIGEVMAASMPSDPDTPLTDDTRKKASEMYTRVANLLEAIK